jgi:hypothetical protein
MAGEQKGKAYEAITKLVLEDLQMEGKVKGRVFWDEKPDGMTIVPDFTIGRSPNAPNVIILVTHSGSAKNSTFKVWRNLGELAEAKTCLPKEPLVFTLLFDSVVYSTLKELGSSCYDGELVVGDRSYGTDLRLWLDAQIKNLPRDKNQKVTHLRELVSSNKNAEKIVSTFKRDLERLLKQKAPADLNGLWRLQRRQTPPKIPLPRKTFVRRGLSKLLVFENVDVALRLYSGDRVEQQDIPGYAYELGLATRAIGRAHPSDPEIRNALETIGKQLARKILEAAPVKKVEGWLLALRNAPHLALMGRYVLDNYDDLCNSDILNKHLISLHDDPSALISNSQRPSNWNPRHVWLLEFLIELIKRHSGNSAGYGYAQLGREVVDSGFTRRSGLGNPRLWVGGFILSDWVRRRGNEKMPRDGVKGIAAVLSTRLKKIPPSEVAGIVNDLPNEVRRNILEAKLLCYKGFEPLLQLIEQSTKRGKKVALQSCFAERADLWRQAGTTTVWKVASSLINWQSVSDAGRDHKKKELCGRAVALRYSWDAKDKTFIPRPGVKKLILVVDGTWRQSDLNALVRSGWDEIFYPDEMDKLAKAIV